MQMYSSDIYITAKVFFVAQTPSEAAEMAASARETAITIPETELFTDRDFKDPDLANLTFATTFNFWGLVDKVPLQDEGPVGHFLKTPSSSASRSGYRLITGTALVGATVYIKAISQPEAEDSFRGLDANTFKLETNTNGVGLLGIRELNGICFGNSFKCHVLQHDQLSHRGSLL